ncbi:hypothetical protein [Streptomyces sp. NPDC096324]|uniref:hypothetical protein n=1 Tax=Streptomyces sp. NPDC096324 TaxID=3366085 RepID=UPI00383035EC
MCDRGAGREYVGVRIQKVTISDRCPTCGGPRGVTDDGESTVRNHNFHEDGDWLSVDTWKNPCGHVDMYSAVLREDRDRAAAERDAADIRDMVEGGEHP